MGTASAGPSRTRVEARFAESRGRLGARRQKLIRSILDDFQETCFLSSREVAKRYQVDAATIIRSVQALGYKRYADFSMELRELLLTRVNPYTVLKAATREKRSVEDHINHSIDKALDNLSTLRSDLDRSRLIGLAKQILRARKVVVVGADMAASIANFLAYGLVALGFDAEAPVASEGTLQHKIQGLTSRDLVIAISFGQCLRVTVESAINARKMGAPTFGITDSDTTPIARYCQNHIVTTTASHSLLGSYAAPMVLINALHVACAHLNPKRSLDQLRPVGKEYSTGARWYREPKETS